MIGWAVFVVCTLMLAAVLAACGGDGGAPPTSGPKVTPTKHCSDGLCLVESNLTEPGGALNRTRRVEGVIMNEGETTYALVEVTFNLYDNKGDLIGSASKDVDDLGPGQRWRFSVIVPASIEADVVDYGLESLKGS